MKIELNGIAIYREKWPFSDDCVHICPMPTALTAHIYPPIQTFNRKTENLMCLLLLIAINLYFSHFRLRFFLRIPLNLVAFIVHRTFWNQLGKVDSFRYKIIDSVSFRPMLLAYLISYYVYVCMSCLYVTSQLKFPTSTDDYRRGVSKHLIELWIRMREENNFLKWPVAL